MRSEYEESPPLGKMRRCKEKRPPRKPKVTSKNESLMTLHIQDDDDGDSDIIEDDLEPVEVGDEFNRDSVLTMRQRR